MKSTERVVVNALAVLLLLFPSAMGSASAQDSPGAAPAEQSCPHQEVKEVPGSQIVFREDAVDFGQIPINRKVSHRFRFHNPGTAPLLVAPHVQSQAIEGC